MGLLAVPFHQYQVQRGRRGKVRKTYITMKHFSVFVQFVLFCAFLTSLTSCGQDEKEEVDEASYVAITSGISPQEYTDIVNSVDEAIMGSTRSLGQELTDMEAQNLLQPFVNDGKQIRNQMITLQRDLELTNTDISLLNGMTDAQLAEFAFTFASICNKDGGITWDIFIDCLKQATGVNDVVDILTKYRKGGHLGMYVRGTKMLMTAKVARQFIVAFAKRTVGIVGVAWTIIEFGQCVASKTK